LLARAAHRVGADEMKGIRTKPGRLSCGDLKHEMEDIVAVTLRFRTELRAGGAFELRIFTLQPVQRAALRR